MEILRGLIDEIRLSPRDGQLDIYLVGNLARILDLRAKKHPGAKDTGVQITPVAGARNHFYRTRLFWRGCDQTNASDASFPRL